MRSAKRSPFSKALDPNKNLNDSEIKRVVLELNGVKVKDFPLHSKWLALETKLSSEELRALRLSKLLYCSGYRREMFLHLGTIIESKINSIVQLYISRQWRTPQNYDANSQANKFGQFMHKKALGEKADLIVNLNLFNNQEASERIKHKIQSFRFLRNYGGHAKTVNEFFQSVIDSQPDCDGEIEDAFNLLNAIESGVASLENNPPPLI